VEYLLIAFVWILNLAISGWNAYACGCAWAEAKHYGGWPRFMCWMGAIMSASGFSWCYLIFLALSGHYLFPEYVTDQVTVVSLQLGYIIIIPGVLFSGLMITVDSWATAYREGGIMNYGVAAYNTYAQIHNTYNAITTFGEAFGNVTSFFSSSGSSSDDDDDSGGAAIAIVIGLVAVAVFGGVLTTYVIINKVAGSHRLPPYQEPNS